LYDFFISLTGTPVAFEYACKEVAFGNMRFHSFTYFDVFVFTPLSVLKGLYAFAVFQDNLDLRVNSNLRVFCFCGDKP
jgi:hypothetical protein